MGRRRRALNCFILAVGLLLCAGMVYSQAGAAGCAPGCAITGLAVFDPFAPPDGPGYALMRTADGQRVRYDPCRTIPVVVNPAGAPPSWRADLQSAEQTIAFATGLTFTDAGLTGERPRRLRAPVQRHRYGRGWAPVLVAWTQTGDEAVIPAGAAGTGGSVWARAGDELPVLVTGEVVLDSATAQRLVPGASAAGSHGRLLAHELGHLVGLAHAGDPASLMAPAVGWSPQLLTAGDQAGLAELGIARGCLPVPAAPR